MDRTLHFYYPWHELEEKFFRRAMREFLDNGVEHFVITDSMIRRMLQEPDYTAFLHGICREFHVRFSTIHAPYGKDHDLNIPVPERRPEMFQDHIKAMETASEFGCRTYTIHMGSSFYCFQHVPLETLRPLAVETLEKLLPTAEKLGMVIAVENSFEKPNSAKEVLGIVRNFDGCPSVGVCYDTGHANCMATAPGKTFEGYSEGFVKCWWEGIEPEDGALELLKDKVVTCHIHDNNGYNDLHGMPFDGTIDWPVLMKKLFDCPNMIEYQTEVIFDEGTNWAGKLLSPAGGYSIRKLADTFRKLGFQY